MSWLRRLSRDRGSKGERDFKEQMPGFRPQSSYNENGHPSPLKDSQFSSTHNSQDMLSYRRPAPQDNQFSSTPPRLPNAISDGTMHTIGPNLAPAPDPLTRAFNDAIKPYLDQIDILKSELDDANGQVQQLETERADMHAWIDKRGLRPGESMLSCSRLTVSFWFLSSFCALLEADSASKTSLPISPPLLAALPSPPAPSPPSWTVR